MALVHLTDQSFDESVTKSDKPVMVDFYADWCGPCRAAAPIIEELAKDYDGKVTVGKVDVDANPGVASKYGVMSIPTVIMFSGGKEVDRQVGYGGKPMYEGLIKKVVK